MHLAGVTDNRYNIIIMSRQDMYSRGREPVQKTVHGVGHVSMSPL